MPRNAKHDCDFGRTFFIQPGKRTGQSMSGICSIISRFRLYKINQRTKISVQITPFGRTGPFDVRILHWFYITKRFGLQISFRIFHTLSILFY